MAKTFENTESELMKWLHSEEGKKSAEEFCNKIEREALILKSQLKRFHQKYSNSFSEIVEKIIAKYESDKYRDFWYLKAQEPPEGLYWFLFEYAQKYGRKCNKKEWEQCGNTFTSALYFVNGYYFNRMDGQGSVIQVKKQK